MGYFTARHPFINRHSVKYFPYESSLEFWEYKIKRYKDHLSPRGI